MSTRGRAFIVGAYEHPLRVIPDRSTSQIHADVALGALADAGLSLSDVDGYFCDSSVPLGPLTIAEYLGLSCRFMESTEIGGSAAIAHVGHAAQAIAAGQCSIALITQAGRPRSYRSRQLYDPNVNPEMSFESTWGVSWMVTGYAMAAQRHMYEYGTTSAQLAEVKVAATLHAQHNPNAFLRKRMTVDDVLNSGLVSDPLHRADCCVVTDGGGALVVVSYDVARTLDRPPVKVLGEAETVKHSDNGRIDVTYTGAVITGPRAFAEAGVTPANIDYASIYDSFTITVLETIEDLGFCKKGDGGPFIASGALRSPDGALPCNTDGGGLANNHPSNRGGVTKVIEAVRQLRGEAHPAVQVPDCALALVHGTGNNIGTRMGSATLILGRDDA